MNFFQGLLLANISMALLAALLLWRAVRQADELRRALGHTSRLATTDSLTDLPNRSRLQAELREALARPRADVALLVIDLDGFKVINDTLGHMSGDELLKCVAERFTACVGRNDMIARLGGDEFAILIRRNGAEKHAGEVALAICNSMEAPVCIGGDQVQVAASIGIAAVAGETANAPELLRRADVAMYVAKADRHAGHRTYQPEMDESLHLRRTISAELEAALVSNQLKLVYQPLVCARTGKVMSAEALMRWPGKEGQAGSPGVFIPIAEETGLISRLGEWAIEQAILEIKRLKTIPIAVNVSPVQFRVDGFADSIEAAILRHQIDPGLLRIEITEGVLISHTEEAKNTMLRLRELGVQVLLDDFGTGYSSLSYLQKFEFDGLKIDRAFIQQLEDGPMGQQLLKSIIALGHSLNMKVVAEGVETESQAAILQLLSCDFLQGYALGRPDAPEKLHEITRPAEMLGGQSRAEMQKQALN